MIENQKQPKAIPFITYSNSQQNFVINPEAEVFLQNIKNKIGIVSIVGKYRTGKSFFINRVLLN